MNTTAATENQSPAASGSWTIDKAHSSVLFAVEHNSATTFRGSFSEIDASLKYDENGVQVSGTVKLESIDLGDEQMRGHVFSPDFFDLERNPELKFVSTGIADEHGEAVVTGDLTIRDETNPVTVRGTIGEPFENLAGSKSIAVRLHTTIDRTAYGLNWQMQLPNGKNVLGNDVTIEVELELVQS